LRVIGIEHFFRLRLTDEPLALEPYLGQTIHVFTDWVPDTSESRITKG
jgi:hypothetical protein